MKAKKAIWAVAIGLLFVIPMGAQQKPGTLSSFEFQTPKNGMVPQYEQGRKQKAQWHKQQKDPLPLLVWEIISGEGTGTYVVGREGQHWADFDKPPVSDEADLAEYNKEIGQYVGSLVTRYYDYMPNVSTIPPGEPTKFAEITVYHVKWGHQSDFRTAIARVTDAIKKTNWPVPAGWYELANGGQVGEFVLVLPHKNWADFENHPNIKPFRDMLKDGLGQAEADSLIKMLDSSVEGATSEIIEFRQDLSYLPGK